jgi:methionine synthase II (cobalamin-independent)
LDEETKELIKLQQDVGLTYIVDGQLFWQDFLRPIAQTLNLHREGSSADENPIVRQVYTNTFYRRPLIQSKILNSNKKLIDSKYLSLIQDGKRKIILPSPFALVYLSDGIHRYSDGRIKREVFKELVLEVAEVLNHEVRRLEENGFVSFVQFNDPCVAYAEESEVLWDSIIESLSIVTKNISCITSLHTYNGDISKFLPELKKLPVQRLGIDVYTTKIKNFSGFNKILEIGIVNANNTLVETPELLVQYTKQIIENIRPKGLALVPNRPLELIPQPVAINKIKSLAKAANLLNYRG